MNTIKFADNYEDMYNNAIDGGVKYLEAYQKVKTLILGLSGGIDSALTAAIAKAATDGLGVSDSDLDQLLPGWTAGYRKGYEFIDKILIALMNKDEYIDAGGETGKLPMLSLEHPVIKRHYATEFKRNNPVNLSRLELIW